MYGISGYYAIDLRFNNQIINASSATSRGIFIMQNVQALLPSCRIQFGDPSGQALSNQILMDGTAIALTMGKGLEDSKVATPSNFIMKGMPDPARPGVGQPDMVIRGILKGATKYLAQLDKAYSGPSSDVISQIAELCGLTPDVDATNDSMTWLPQRSSRGLFAKLVAQHGWIDDSSCMSLVVREDGTLRYKNVTTIIKGKPVATFYDIVKPSSGTAHQILDHRVISKAAVFNSLASYGTTSITVGQDGSTTKYDSVSATRLSNNLSMSPTVKTDSKSVGSRYVPSDLGNCHDQYIKAEHQNIRLRSLFSFDVEILTDEETSLGLLDLVQIDIRDSATLDTNDAVSGNYIVTGKTRTISGNRYMEKFLLSSQGPNVSKLQAGV